MFPPSWRDPDGGFEQATDLEHGFLDETMRSCPMVMIVLYDPSKRAPASQGDFLGIMSLGCVMQNMWLTAETLGIGMQIMSVFSAPHVQGELRKILSIPDHLNIAFACRLGYSPAEPVAHLRVRREIERFTHRNMFAALNED
jgi:nitroreductase